MIDWLFSLLLPLTLLLLCLMVCHKTLLTRLGVNSVYSLWLIVPVGLFVFSLPLSWLESNAMIDIEIQRFLVIPTKNIQQNFSAHWIIVAWEIVASMMMCYWLLNHFSFKKQLALKRLTKAELVKLDIVITLPNKLKIYQSSHAFSPMLIGLYEQKLVIPENFNQLYNHEQQQLILAHEICHFDRNDIYWNLIAFSFLALFWFHPLVWLAYFRFRRDQELSCDHIVLARKQLSSRINYSRALLVAAETSLPLAFAQLSFKKYGDKEVMFERIKQIKLNTKASKLSLSLISLLSIGLFSALSYAGNIGDSTLEQQHPISAKVKEQVMPIHRVEPKYPLKAAEEKIEGAVVLRFDIDKSGDVQNVEVMKAVPANVFNRVAITALKQWKYDAKGSSHKNMLVQLDFRMDENSSFQDVNLIEKIKITR